MKDIESEISRCIIKLLMKEPFYAHFLSGIIRVVTNEIPTAAVGFKSGKIALRFPNSHAYGEAEKIVVCYSKYYILRTFLLVFIIEIHKF